MSREVKKQTEVVIKFAGDSGDGMQLTGTQFTNTAALFGNDLATFPDFPAEIRAPQGTLFGVSGFQVHFGSKEIYTPGDDYDVLVAMNAAAFKTNISKLKPGGVLIMNTDGFGRKNLKLSKYTAEENPEKDLTLEQKYRLFKIPISQMTKRSAEGIDIEAKSIERSKNMFVLGFVYWLYNRGLENTIDFIQRKFVKKESLVRLNTTILKAGYHYGETVEASIGETYQVDPAKKLKGIYRNITGNVAISLGLITAAQKAQLQLFFGGYPITPASDILNELAKHKNFGVRTFQAEDEIAAVCSAIGASFGGQLAVTASSGPGIALKGEAIGLATMMETPLVIINVQRGGPSTGMPTKTEQSDLLQAMYGRNGEAPIPVLAARTPSDCFFMAIEACRIAVQHMTPVFLLSDGAIANGAEPWKIPCLEGIPAISAVYASPKDRLPDEDFLPYKRDERLVRSWAIPGTSGLEHRVGGLAKEENTGNVSYDPINNEKMMRLRAEKVNRIADFIPLQSIDQGASSGKLLIVGWGSTFGSIKFAVKEAISMGYEVAHTHLNYIHPMPRNFEKLLAQYDTVLVPEMNGGQLVKLIRETYAIPAVLYSKMKGQPFTKTEILQKIKQILD